MRYACTCLLISILLPFFSTGQTKPIDLSGIIIVNGNSTFAYKLVFTDSAGVLKGYTITNVHRKDETKARIEGTIDLQKQTISYKETGIVYSKAALDSVDLCMVSAHLKYKQASKGMMLTGSFYGKEMKTGNECGKGTITMLNTDALNELFNPSPKKDTVLNVKKDVPKKIITNPIDTFTTYDEITDGIQTVYDWRSDTVIIDIWDGGKIDYDMVTVLYNKDTLIKRYTLKAEKLRLYAPVVSNGVAMDQLIIIAENEGSEPPNTANITLIDEEKKYNVLAYNNVGYKAVIHIKKISGR
jgi:hypothetical protein